MTEYTTRLTCINLIILPMFEREILKPYKEVTSMFQLYRMIETSTLTKHYRYFQLNFKQSTLVENMSVILLVTLYWKPSMG